MTQQAWTLEFILRNVTPNRGEFDVTETPRRWWSGDYPLMLDDGMGNVVSWQPSSTENGALMGHGPISDRAGAPGRRTRALLAITSQSLRRLLTVDLGAIDIRMGDIFADDPVSGTAPAWRRTPAGVFYGRISNGKITDDDIFECDLETDYGDLDRRKPVYLSRETQRAEFPGDSGLDQLPELAEGLVDIRWPPYS